MEGDALCSWFSQEVSSEVPSVWCIGASFVGTAGSNHGDVRVLTQTVNPLYPLPRVATVSNNDEVGIGVVVGATWLTTP